MERQLTLLGHEAILRNSDFSTQESEFIQNLRIRCQVILKQHHEYRQLCTRVETTKDSSLQDVLSEVEENISICVTFLLACMDFKQLKGEETQSHQQQQTVS